ncbi:MAG: nicotinate (nicotinamide) nucleotide adenylyltransferase [Clostridia bacterium]|nr:nicotinate (nicotinamide) nucleotide adenylyltransferase [Clostridia bacterium]
MKIALFGGSFDPVHQEHVQLVLAAQKTLGFDRVIVLPAYISPFKRQGASASGKDRFEMCKIAFKELPFVTVSDFELAAGDVSYSYLTCRHFREIYPEDELYFLLGADSLQAFSKWKKPEEILRCVTLCAVGRGSLETEQACAEIEKLFNAHIVRLPYTGEDVSSTRIRVELLFGKKPKAIDENVFVYIRKEGLYTHPSVLPALALEKESRREHSFRVALLSAACAPRFGISQEQAILASALHDCGKYVPLDSPLLKGFTPPSGVPAPVLHQFTGAFLAEREFGITDEEVLDAICYHTSGRANMTKLGELVFLADMLEEDRDFDGVERLRKVLQIELDECFLLSLEEQINYLKASGKEVYPLTMQAFEWAKRRKTTST